VLEAPTAILPKERDVGESVGPDGCPVAVSVIAWEVLDVESVTVRVAVRVPICDGVNAIDIWQTAADATDEPHWFPRLGWMIEKSPALVPLMLAVGVMVVLPLLVRVTIPWYELPTGVGMLPKAPRVNDVPAKMPVPLNGTFPIDVTIIAVRSPVPVGLKVTFATQKVL
jgi:hypothetical protein